MPPLKNVPRFLKGNLNLLVLAGVLLAIFITAIAGVLGLFHLETTSKNLKQTAQQFDTKSHLVNALRDLAGKRLSTLQAMLLEDDPFVLEEHYIQHLELGGEFLRARDHLRGMELRMEEQLLMEAFQQVTADSAPFQASVRQLALDGQNAEARQLMSEMGYPMLEAILQQLSNMLDFYQNATQNALDIAAAQTQNDFRNILVLTVLVLIASVIVGIIFVRRIAVAEKGMHKEIDIRKKIQSELESYQESLEEEVSLRTKDLAESEAQTTAILQTAPDCIITTDEDGIVHTFNPAAEITFGYSANEIIGQHILTLIPSAYHKIYNTDFLRYKDIRKSEIIGETIEIEGLCNDKSVIPIEARLAKVNLMGRSLFTGIFRDISERKKLEAQLLQAQKLESIGELAAGVAHEINTPTQYVADNTHFLKDAFEDIQQVIDVYERLMEQARTGAISAELIAEVEQVYDEADMEFITEETPKALVQAMEGLQKISTIVNAMKEFSHPGSDEMETVDINRLLENTITVSRNEWKHVADMETELDDTLPHVPGYGGKLSQVFLNLIVNAAHAIAGVGGEEGGDEGVIKVSTRSDDKWVEVRISDTGPGIPDALKERIFDPFFTTKEVGKGTGQGLALAHSVIVEKHNGELFIDQQAEQGATFVIRLPINK